MCAPEGQVDLRKINPLVRRRAERRAETRVFHYIAKGGQNDGGTHTHTHTAQTSSHCWAHLLRPPIAELQILMWCNNPCFWDTRGHKWIIKPTHLRTYTYCIHSLTHLFPHTHTQALTHISLCWRCSDAHTQRHTLERQHSIHVDKRVQLGEYACADPSGGACHAVTLRMRLGAWAPSGRSMTWCVRRRWPS